MKVVVLMSTYNGEKFLEEQIASVLNQDVQEFAELQLVVRDDGSQDTTREILERYAREGKLSCYFGENLRPEKSFWHLLRNAPEADYYAFCDQDDFWFPDKLSRAVKMLSGLDPEKPLLYCSAFTATDAQLKPIVVEKNPMLERFTDYAHALIYSTAPGCTFVFNHRARVVAEAYDMENQCVFIHDWLIHKIVTILGGEMIFDPEPSIFYRQHGNNEIGAHATGMKGFAEKARHFLVGKGKQTRSDCARSLLAVYGDQVSQTVFDALDLVGNYRSSTRKKWRFLWDKRFFTGTINDFFLKCLILLHKV